MSKFKFLLFQILISAITIKAYGQCTCTVPSGVTGFANCIQVTSTIDNTSITAASSCDGSLRWAILKANTLMGGTYIKFNIAGSGARVFYFNTSLPPITSKVYLDGQSISGFSLSSDPLIQFDFNYVLPIAYWTQTGLITLDGANGSIVDGVLLKRLQGGISILNSSNIIVRNCVFIDFYSIGTTTAAISMGRNSNYNLLENNYIGISKSSSTYSYDYAGWGIYLFGDYWTDGLPYSCSSNTVRNNFMKVKLAGVRVFESVNGTPADYNLISKNIITITQNIFPNRSIVLISNNYGSPNQNEYFPIITSIDKNNIFGTCNTPNVKIEIFISDDGGRSSLVYFGTTTANSSGNWTLNRGQWTDTGFLINHTITFVGTATDVQNNTSELSPPFTLTCPNLSIVNLPAAICSDATPITLQGFPAGGTFSGPNVSGSTFTPAALVSPGTYTLTYTYISVPADCPTTKSQKVFISPILPSINRVISATATTYSDAWPMDYTNVTSVNQSQRDGLDGDGTNEVANGTKGTWHGEESYVYVEKRNQNTPLVAIKTDGIYNNMPLFDHTSALNGGCTKWRLVNTITEYNPSSYDLENKDILKRFSAALYGYKGDLAVAVASNAREREIAFESFEEYTVAAAITPGNLTSGNLSVYTSTPTVVDFSKVYRSYEVLQATDNVLTVDFPYLKAASWSGRIARVTGGNINGYDNKDIYGKFTIASVASHPTDVNQSLITLSSTDFTHTGIWKGKISLSADYGYSLPIAVGASNLSIVSSTKHTGKNSLKTTGDASFEQIKLELIPGEKYVLSAWVSADLASYTYRVTSGTGRRGFTVEYLDKSGTSLGTQLIDLDDKNPVVEGWQKIEGVFQFPVAPTTAERVVIYFNSPAGTNTYWDDIRLFPFTSNMQTYVYNPLNYKVSAVLDNNNYASLYYYDAQGNLFLVKKETEKGIQTIQESFSHQKQ